MGPAGCLNRPDFSPSQPWRAETRLSQARPKRVKGRGGTDRTSCEPFALVMDLGERKTPSSDSGLRESLPYVEPLNDARTKLGSFFNTRY